MTNPDAKPLGTYLIDGTVEINRLGFGAIRVTGPGVWGEPSGREQSKRTLNRLIELNIFCNRRTRAGRYVKRSTVTSPA